MKLEVKAFAFATAVLSGLCLFVITWWMMAFEGINNDVTILSKIYRGYNISPMGSIVGFVWGFLGGLFGGGAFAWFYNALIDYNK